MKKRKCRERWTQSHQVSASPLLAKRLLLLSSLIALLGFLAGCVSTPSTPPVVSKQQGNSGSVQNNTQNTNLLADAPQTYTFHATQGAVTLDVNAPVQLPSTSKIPVSKVQSSCFTQNSVDKVINTFMPGKPLYQIGEHGDTVTKAEMEKTYTVAKALTLPGAQGNKEIITQQAGFARVYITGYADGADSTSHNKYSLTNLQQMVADTPATVAKTPVTGQLQRLDEGDIQGRTGVAKGYHGLELNLTRADSGKGYDMQLSAGAFTSPKLCYITFTNHDITSVYNYSDLTGSARGMRMSLDQAKTLAQHTADAIGATDLQLTQVRLGTLIPLTANDDPQKMNQAYGMWFTRHVAGVPTTMDLTEPDSQQGYSAVYDYERLFMLINDDGVIELFWNSPMTDAGLVSDNATIKSFHDAMNTFQQQFMIHYAQNDTSKGNTTYSINRITLGLMRVKIKDQDDLYQMVPVWDFFGTINPKPTIDRNQVWDSPAAADALLSDRTMRSLLTVNAIDGSIIDRKQGY